jgi:hypothetical protein
MTKGTAVVPIPILIVDEGTAVVPIQILIVNEATAGPSTSLRYGRDDTSVWER